jgi:hypothetical protein
MPQKTPLTYKAFDKAFVRGQSFYRPRPPFQFFSCFLFSLFPLFPLSAFSRSFPEIIPENTGELACRLSFLFDFMI